MEQQKVAANFLSKIIFIEEPHLPIDSFVNLQNGRIWVSEKPQVFNEKRVPPQHVTVWYLFFT